MKKVVLKLNVDDNKDKQKAMKLVSSLRGIESITIDMKEKKLTVIGDVDPVCVVKKLRKSFCCAEILTVGPAKPAESKVTCQVIKCCQMGMINRDCYGQCYTRYPICITEDNPPSCVIS